MKQGHFSMIKLESEKHKSWGMPAEGFKGHVATDGSLLGTAGVDRYTSHVIFLMQFTPHN